MPARSACWARQNLATGGDRGAARRNNPQDRLAQPQTLDCRGGIERDAVAGFIARLGREHHG